MRSGDSAGLTRERERGSGWGKWVGLFWVSGRREGEEGGEGDDEDVSQSLRISSTVR